MKNSFREKLVDISSTYMLNHLGIEKSELELPIQLLKLSHCKIIEIAHTPQIPHLGIFQIYLQAIHDAVLANEKNSPTIVLFSVNDYVEVGELSETRYLRYFISGSLPLKPLSIGVHGREKKVPIVLLDAPSRQSLDNLQNRLLHGVRKNFVDTGIKSLKKIEQFISKWFESVIIDSDRITLSDWFNKITVDALQFCLGAKRLPLLILPTTLYSKIFYDILLRLDVLKNSINEIKNSTVGFNSVPISSTPGWVLSTKQKRLSRHIGVFDISNLVSSDNYWVPDVVTRQALSSYFDIDIRYHGNFKPYQHVADRTAEEVFGHNPPKRKHFTSQILYHGVGWPKSGDIKAGIYPVLFEVEAQRLRDLIIHDRNSILRIYSDYLAI